MPKSFAINPFATETLDLDVTESKPSRRESFCARRAVPHGEIVTIEYASAEFAEKRTIDVYLPPDYTEDGDTRYPALYLLHPHGLTGGWQTSGATAHIVDNLIDEGEIPPMIVAMPNGNLPLVSALEDEVAAKASDSSVSRHVIDEVVAEVEGNFAVEADGLHRALAGASDGGFHALRVGLTEIETFGWVGSFGGAIQSNNLPHYFQAMLKDSATGRWKMQLLWLGAGQDDPMTEINAPFADLLVKHKFDFEQETYPGGHDWSVWRKCLFEFLPELFTDLDFFEEYG